MPRRRKTVSDAELLAAYTRLKNGRAVARELGLHENTVYKRLRPLRGTCIDCSNPLSPGHKYCDKCLKRIRERAKRKRAERRRNGICAECNEVVQPPSRTYCTEHRLAHIDQRKRAREKTKRRHVHGGTPSKKQRHRSLRRYGPHAITVWEKAGGKCATCGVAHEEKVVHIHHIDGDNTNNEAANLCCLCFRCHMTAERLLSHPDLQSFIQWFRSTYPDLPL